MRFFGFTILIAVSNLPRFAKIASTVSVRIAADCGLNAYQPVTILKRDETALLRTFQAIIFTHC